MNRDECAVFLAGKLPGGKRIYEKHMRDYGEVLLHIIVWDMINYPLVKLLKENSDPGSIKLYCATIEEMHYNGDEEVRNALEVSVLEYFTDEPEIWQRFGTYISDEFRQHINNESIPENLCHLQAEKLKGR